MPFALICSPEPAVVESLRQLLGPDWSTFTETSAVGVLRLADDVPADVVFIDEYVRDAELVDVVHALRTRDADVTLVALALSTRTAHVAAALPAGLDEVLTKPFDRDAAALLVHRVRDRIRRRATAPEPPPPIAPGAVNAATAGEHRTLTHALRTIFRAAGTQTDARQAAQLLLDALCELCNLNRGAILWETAGGRYTVMATTGIRRDRLEAMAFRDETGLVAWLRVHNRLCTYPPAAPAELPGLVQQEMRLLQAALAFPLVADGQLRGVLALGNKVTGVAFDADELDLILCVAQYAGSLLYSTYAQARARGQRALFEGVVEHLASGVVMIDAAGTVQVINAAAGRVLNVTPAAVLGEPVQRLGSLSADLLLRTLAGETEYRRHRVVNSATAQPMGVNTSRLRDDAGAVVGAIMVCTTLTAVGDVEPAASAAAEMDTWHRFAVGMAHAIKNPLVAIKTFAQLFPDHHEDADFAKNFHAVALREVDRLDHLVEDLMRYGGAGEPECEPCDLHALLAEAMAHQDPVEEGIAAVDVESGAEPVVALADRREIGDAIGHMVLNAREAAGATGHVWVRARRSANGEAVAVIEVEDSGPGFPKDAEPQVFSPFFTTKDKGLGLGLALTERTARRHGGEVTIGQSARGGAKVTLRLPLAKTE